MSYDEEEHRRSRVVVETPTEKREVVQHQVVRAPERKGFSTGMVAAVALAAIAATAIIFLFVMTKEDDDDTSVSANVRVAAQATPVAQQPVMAPQSPVVQPTPAVIIVPQPIPMESVPPPTSAAPSTATAPTANATEDVTIEGKIKKVFNDDETLKNAGLSVIVAGGRAMLSGSVRSQEAKEKAVELARSVSGVKDVDASLVTVATSVP